MVGWGGIVSTGEMGTALTSQAVISSGTSVHAIRGQSVMLDAEVARRFGVSTRALNQAVARNPRKFGAAHCFRLNSQETADLISQSVTSSSGHGGLRKKSMVYTMLGVARLATVLTSDEALRATDLILTTFLEVRAQVAAGRTAVHLHNPARLTVDGDEKTHDAAFRRKLRDALSNLLDSVIDVRSGATIADTAGVMASDALSHLRERLRTRGLENEKIVADTLLVLNQAELVAAQARETDARTDGLKIANLRDRIALVRDIADVHGLLEAPALIAMLDDLGAPAALPSPEPKDA